MAPHGINLDSQAVRDFCKKWKITELCVFGSVLRDDFGPKSDVDFLVTYSPGATWDLFDVKVIKDELARIIGRPVDLISRSAIERSDNRFVKKEILSSAELLYAEG